MLFGSAPMPLHGNTVSKIHEIATPDQQVLFTHVWQQPTASQSDAAKQKSRAEPGTSPMNIPRQRANDGHNVIRRFGSVPAASELAGKPVRKRLFDAPHDEGEVHPMPVGLEDVPRAVDYSLSSSVPTSPLSQSFRLALCRAVKG